jgi:aryl-alcohol dehydrogenase-like predicted oxidoreductase
VVIDLYYIHRVDPTVPIESRRKFIVPIVGTSHSRWIEENAASAGLNISADTEDALDRVFAPGAAVGARYPADHLALLLI